MKWEDFSLKVPGFINVDKMEEILPDSYDDVSNMIDDAVSKTSKVQDILYELKKTYVIPRNFVLKIKECIDVIAAAQNEFNKGEDEMDLPRVWIAMHTVHFILDAIMKYAPNLKLKEESSQ